MHGFLLRRTRKDTAQKKTLIYVNSGTTLVDFAHCFYSSSPKS
jgi:hypothetical protein